MRTLVLTPSTSRRTLYVGPHCGKVPAAGLLSSYSVVTVSTHGFDVSLATTFFVPDSIHLAESTGFSFFRGCPGQLPTR